MAVNTIRVVEALSQLSEHENLRIAITESGKGALIVGGCAFVGGLLGGPVGLGIGGVIGAVTGAINGSGKYKSVAYLIMYDMTSEQQARLANSLIRALQSVGTTDVLIMLTSLTVSPLAKSVALDVLKHFLTSEGYSLC